MQASLVVGGHDFLGRELEMGVLGDALQAALAGQGRLVLIGGEPGIGKTRLCEELAAAARDNGARVLWGRCSEDAGAPAFWPWTQLLRACTNLLDPDALRQLLGDGAPDVAQLVPQMRERLPNLPIPTGLDSAQARFRLFDAVARVLERLARRRPLVVIVDDLHGADQPSLLLLQFVVRALRDWPLLLVGAYRDTTLTREHPLTDLFVEALRQPGTERLTLSGLSPSEVARFIEITAAVKASAAVVAAIHQQTEGNPLFVAEYVRLLLADPAQSALQTAPAALAVPQSVKAVIGRRVVPLSRECNVVLNVASVIGRQFDGDVLECVVAAEADATPCAALLQDIMREAIAARVVVEVPGPLRRYRFSHALIRETLYGELSASHRMELHQRVGEAIEQRMDTGERSGELAYHFFEADNDKAVTYARRAGDRAVELLAYEEAVRLYQLGLSALEKSGVVDQRPLCEFLLSLGVAQNRAGDGAVAKEAFLRATDAARALGDRELLSRAALGYGGDFQFPEAGYLDEEHIGLLREALQAWGGQDHDLHARLLGQLAIALYFTHAEAERVALCERAVAMARGLGDRATLAYALRATHAATWGPNPRERLAIVNELLHLAQQQGDRLLAFSAHHWRMCDQLELFNAAAVSDAYDACRTLAAEVRQPALEVWLMIIQAARAMLEGHLEEAERLVGETLAHGRWLGRAADTVFGIQMFALRLVQGRQGEMVDFIRAGIALHPGIPAFRGALAVIYARDGRTEEAHAELDPLTDVLYTLPKNIPFLATLCHVAEAGALSRHAASMPVCYDLLLPYHDIAVTMGNGVAYLGSVAYYLGVLAAGLSRYDDAARHFEEALVHDTRLGARPWHAATQCEYGALLMTRAGTSAQQLDDRARTEELLEQAHRVAHEIGTKHVAERAAALSAGLTALTSQQTQDAHRPRADQSPMRTGRGPETGILRNEGDYWAISYAGKTLRLRESKGLRYIAHLLRHPGREVHALELAQEALSGDEVAGAAANPGKGDTGIPLLDTAAKAAYRSRVHELRTELAEAEEMHDRGRIERAREEMEAIGTQLAAAVGLGGRDRMTSSHAERARSAVTKRIKDTIRRIGQANPDLGRYLTKTIVTGYFCTYLPDPAQLVTWMF